MKNRLYSFLLASVLLTISTCLQAEEEHRSYSAKVGHKALNGFTNMATAVLELPKNIINTTNDSNIAMGTVGGMAKGILNMVGRLVTGATDLVTAPLPTKPIIYPAYIWDDFDADTTYGAAFRLDDK